MSELLRLPKDAIPMINTSKKRDVTIYCATTFEKTTMGVEIIGAKDEDICQFNAEWKANQLPVRERHVRKAFEELCEMTIEKMRRAGLLG